MGFIKTGGLYKGIIVDVNDPSGKFHRVKVRILRFHGTVKENITNKSSILNNTSSVFSVHCDDNNLPWCEVAFPFGSDFTPEVGQVVVVGFLSGDVSQPVVLGWMGYDYTDFEQTISAK